LAVGRHKENGREKKEELHIAQTRTLKFEHVIVWRVEFFNADGSGYTTDKGSAIAQTGSEKKTYLDV
jgi:hypothetical protein